MKDLRSPRHLRRETQFEIDVDGEKITAYKGETVAAALTATDKRIFNHTVEGKVQGLYCGIGLCWNCLMEIDGVANTRACQTIASPGCRVRTQKGKGQWLPDR